MEQFVTNEFKTNDELFKDKMALLRDELEREINEKE